MKKFVPLLLVFAFYFGGTPLIWAQEELLVVRGNRDYPPYEMIVDGQLVGVHIDLVRAVAEQLKINVTFDSVPWNNALEMLKQGEADAITYINKTPDREKFAIFLEDNILSGVKFVFLTLKEHAPKIAFDGDIGKLLEAHTIVIHEEYLYNSQIDPADFIQKYDVHSLETIADLLLAKEYELAIVNWSAFKETFQGTQVMERVIPLSPPVYETSAYIAFSKARKRAKLAKRFGETLSAFKQMPEYIDILQRYHMGR